MVHRLLQGRRAVEVAQDLLRGQQIMQAFDLSPYFVNCVRVISLPPVITPEDQAKFDQILINAGTPKDVQLTPDVGAPLEVIGRPIIV